MSSRCRICTEQMPKDRNGFEQVCPNCKKKGHRELYEMNKVYCKNCIFFKETGFMSGVYWCVNPLSSRHLIQSNKEYSLFKTNAPLYKRKPWKVFWDKITRRG